MKEKRVFKDRFFWLIALLIGTITFLHYSNLMSAWELHIFFRKLYYIPIILSAFRYRLKGGLISSIIISILYAPHLVIFGNGLSVSIINQYLEMILFLTIGYITGKLVEADYEKQRTLEKQVIEITKLQNYTKSIVDSIKGGILSADSNFIITSANKEILRILGLKEVLGLNLMDIFKNQALRDIFNQAKVQRLHFTDINTKIELGGKEKYLSLNISPLVDSFEDVQGLVITIEDRSREKFLEAQAVRAERLFALEQLATGIAHEIRNPLGIIKTIVQSLQEENVHEEISEAYEIIIKEIDRANRVIDSLLDFSRPMKNEMKEHSLNEILDEVVLITGAYLRKHEAVLKLELDRDVNILADKEKLKQVFINIILNAVESMEGGGAINIKTVVEGKGVNISLRDTGSGIKKEDLEKIFNPFFTTKEKGLGLGLSLSHRIIQDHDGYITIDSTEFKGTQIDIYLPTL